MSNHIHLIFSAKEKGTQSDILRDLKKFTAKKLVESIQKNPAESRKEWILEKLYFAGSQNSNNKYVQLWQQDNHPIEIFSPKVISQKIEYVHNNPIVTSIVSEAHHYLYSSARDYNGIKGLIDVEILDIPSSLVGYVLST
jgi:putative transposase